MDISMDLSMDLSMDIHIHGNPGIIIRSRNLVSSLHWFQSRRGLSYEVSMQLLQITWHRFILNEDTSATTGLLSISDTISHRPNALFGHVARLSDDVPAHKALKCHINLSLGRPLSSQWRCRPGRPIADGSINSGQITTFHLQTSGGVLSTVVTERQRYGPCRLSDNNNNNKRLLLYKKWRQCNQRQDFVPVDLYKWFWHLL